MTSIGEILNRSQKRLEVLLGTPEFTIGGTPYPCVPSTVRRGTQIEVGGYVSEVKLTLIVRRDELATAPAINSKITFDGAVHRVVSVNTPAGGSHFEIDVSLLK